MRTTSPIIETGGGGTTTDVPGSVVALWMHWLIMTVDAIPDEGVISWA